MTLTFLYISGTCYLADIVLNVGTSVLYIMLCIGSNSNYINNVEILSVHLKYMLAKNIDAIKYGFVL